MRNKTFMIFWKVIVVIMILATLLFLILPFFG
jgi:hypothetical protein